MTDSEPADPYLVRLYKATTAGYERFKKDIFIAHKAGYAYVNTQTLGASSFMAVFKLSKEDDPQYEDLAGVDDWGQLVEPEGNIFG